MTEDAPKTRDGGATARHEHRETSLDTSAHMCLMLVVVCVVSLVARGGLVDCFAHIASLMRRWKSQSQMKLEMMRRPPDLLLP